MDREPEDWSHEWMEKHKRVCQMTQMIPRKQRLNMGIIFINKVTTGFPGSFQQNSEE